MICYLLAEKVKPFVWFCFESEEKAGALGERGLSQTAARCQAHRPYLERRS
jgi:hypothetical protein